MDAKLAELYGTNQPEGTDVEKLAAAQLAETLGGEGGQELDVNNITDEQVEQYAAQVLAAEGGEQPAEVTDPEEAAKEKVSEADYLGRVMAHAYVQELRGIQEETAKTAAAYGGAEKEEHKRIARGASNVSGGFGALGGAVAGAASGKSRLGKVVKGVGGAVAGGLAGKGYGYGMTRAGNRVARAIGGEGKKEKKSEAEPSALNILAERRALEICEANGIDPTQLTLVEQPAVEKTSAPADEVLEAAVMDRATELLAQYGVTVTPAE